MELSQRTDLEKSTCAAISVGKWKKTGETIGVSDEPSLVYLDVPCNFNSLGLYGREHSKMSTILRRKFWSE